MKRYLILLIVLMNLALQAQVVIGIGPKTLAPPQGNEEKLRQLKDKSFILTFYYYTGDTVPDRLLIQETKLIHTVNGNYCIMYRDDTTKVAISIVKLEQQKGYTVTTFRVNGKITRIFRYDINIIPTGCWVEYYNNGRLKSKGGYANGKKIKKWKYYDNDGHKDRTEIYKEDGTVLRTISKV